MYAKVGIALMGIVAVLIATRLEMDGTIRSVATRIRMPITLVYASVNIPLVLGILGLRTNQASWTAFCLTYFSTLGTMAVTGWRSHLGKNALVEYFLVAAPLATLAYFLTHLYLNGGIVTLERGKHTTAERLWVPTWQGMRQGFSDYFNAVLNLPYLSRKEVAQGRPAQSLNFSLLIFFLYMFSGIVGGHKGGDSLPEFMGLLHFVGIALCCGLMLGGIWPRTLKPYFALYWLATLFYCLPLGGTVTFLRMHEGAPSMFLFVGSFVLLSFLVSSRAFFWMTVWGLALAHLGWYVMVGALPTDLWTGTYVGACFVLLILVIAVLSFGHATELHVGNRLYVNQALAGAVTHEAMEPLQGMATASSLAYQADEHLVATKSKAGKKGYFLPEERRTDIKQTSDLIDESIGDITKQFSRYKTLLKKNIYQEKQEKVSMKALIEEALPDVVKRYGSKFKVKVTCTQDFEAYMLREFFDTVLANLLKNAYLHGAAKQMEITIDGKGRKVYVRDNGSGIAPEVLPRIFDFRFTTGDSHSSGIGLALVDLILTVAGVKISCKSRHGDKDSFTEFVMTFPAL